MQRAGKIPYEGFGRAQLGAGLEELGFKGVNVTGDGVVGQFESTGLFWLVGERKKTNCPVIRKHATLKNIPSD